MRSVPQSDIPQSPFLWSRGTAARETLRYLDRNAIDAEPLLLKAELSRDQVSPESGGISVASQHRLLELAAIEMNDSLLGLHVAAEMDLRDAGILFLPCRGFGDGRVKLSNTWQQRRQESITWSQHNSRTDQRGGRKGIEYCGFSPA